MKKGQKIGNFEVIGFKKVYVKTFDSNGNRKYVLRAYALLLSETGEERVLRVGKTSLADCEMYMPTFGHKMKYKTHNMI